MIVNSIKWSIKATPERLKEHKKMKLFFLAASLVLLVVIIMAMIIIMAKDRFLGNSIFSGAIDDIAFGLGAAAIIGLVMTTVFLLQRFKEKDYILDEEGVLITSKNKQTKYLWRDIRT